MQNIERNVMKSVKINKDELLGIIKNNRSKHIDEFVEAVEDYKSLVLFIAKNNLKLAKSANLDQFKDMKYTPAAPKSYENSYDKAIRMLELSVEDVIEIDDTTFNQLVLDDWNWKDNFISSNFLYKNFK